MHLCFDEQLTVHATDGDVALCGKRNMLEEAYPESFDGTEKRCKTCDKLRKKRDRVSRESESVDEGTLHSIS